MLDNLIPGQEYDIRIVTLSFNQSSAALSDSDHPGIVWLQ